MDLNLVKQKLSSVNKDDIKQEKAKKPVIGKIPEEYRCLIDKDGNPIKLIPEPSNEPVNPKAKELANKIRELRQMVGCGMMDCKKALVEADWDMEAAIEILRNKLLFLLCIESEGK